MSYGDKPYGLRDVKVTNIGGTVQKDVAVAQQLAVRVRLKSGELPGDDGIAAVISFVEAAEWTLQKGGISLDALAIITGQATTVSGTTPNEKTTLSLDAGDSMPYFKIYGKSIGDGADDIHVKLWKCKCTAIDGTFQNGQFLVTNCQGIAISDGSNGVIDLVQNETAANLPTT